MQRFRSGNYSLEDEPRPGRPREFNDEKLRALIEQNFHFNERRPSVNSLRSTRSTIHRHLKAIEKVSKLGQ